MADQRGTVGIATDPNLVQRNIDNGRQQVCLTWEGLTISTSESALTNATSRVENAVALAAASSYTVPTGKALRITAVNLALNGGTAVTRLRVRIRQAGTVANTSPIIWQGDVGYLSVPTANAGTQQDYAVPDGVEVAASQQITATWIAAASASGPTLDIVIIGYLYSV